MLLFWESTSKISLRITDVPIWTVEWCGEGENLKQNLKYPAKCRGPCGAQFHNPKIMT